MGEEERCGELPQRQANDDRFYFGTVAQALHATLMPSLSHCDHSRTNADAAGTSIHRLTPVQRVKASFRLPHRSERAWCRAFRPCSEIPWCTAFCAPASTSQRVHSNDINNLHFQRALAVRTARFMPDLSTAMAVWRYS